jgi:hypothetical protein
MKRLRFERCVKSAPSMDSHVPLPRPGGGCLLSAIKFQNGIEVIDMPVRDGAWSNKLPHSAPRRPERICNPDAKAKKRSTRSTTWASRIPRPPAVIEPAAERSGHDRDA